MVLLMKRYTPSLIALGLVLTSTVAMANDPYANIITDQENGRYQQALNQISTLLVQDQDDIQAMLLKGNVNKLMGNTSEATTIFKQLIELHPQLPEAYNNLAVIYADKGETALAIETLQQAFATSDSYATAYKNLRALYSEMASSAYREALDIAKPKKKQSQFALLNKTQVPADEPLTEKVVEVKNTTAGTVTAVNEPVFDTTKAVGNMIADWAEAWSSREVTAYFAYYHPTFKPPQGMSRKIWELSRGKRLTKPKSIKVEVVGLVVQPNSSDTATAIFEQHYRSDTYADTVVKKLSLRKHGGQWLIVEEATL